MNNKKIIPILILLIIIVYLAIYIVKDIPKNRTEHLNNTTVNQNTTENKNTEKLEEWQDNNPIVVGLYHNDSAKNKKVLKKEYTEKWEFHKDIISFNVFYSNEEEIDIKKNAILYEEYANKYENIDNYRIGYIIEFNDLKVQIIRPSDTEKIYNTLEVYLYDAIAHKNDSWYSHVTENDFNKNTLLQGIKLTAGKNINDITTDIKLTVFTYDDDDFDEIGNYRGNCTYSLIIKKS